MFLSVCRKLARSLGEAVETEPEGMLIKNGVDFDLFSSYVKFI